MYYPGIFQEEQRITMKNLLGYPVFGPIFEPDTSSIRSSITSTASTFGNSVDLSLVLSLGLSSVVFSCLLFAEWIDC
jgi:hypothetical protein